MVNVSEVQDPAVSPDTTAVSSPPTVGSPDATAQKPPKQPSATPEPKKLDFFTLLQAIFGGGGLEGLLDFLKPKSNTPAPEQAPAAMVPLASPKKEASTSPAAPSAPAAPAVGMQNNQQNSQGPMVPMNPAYLKAQEEVRNLEAHAWVSKELAATNRFFNHFGIQQDQVAANNAFINSNDPAEAARHARELAQQHFPIPGQYASANADTSATYHGLPGGNGKGRVIS